MEIKTCTLTFQPKKNEHNLIQSNDILHNKKKIVQKKKHFKVSQDWNQVKNECAQKKIHIRNKKEKRKKRKRKKKGEVIQSRY
jgi:hypothetical protein